VRDVTCTVYEGMRHEILQEAEAERVMADVVAWMSRRCGEERA
jgi:alpha-beta hydrolase superfamily lysophospholipase